MENFNKQDGIDMRTTRELNDADDSNYKEVKDLFFGGDTGIVEKPKNTEKYGIEHVTQGDNLYKADPETYEEYRKAIEDIDNSGLKASDAFMALQDVSKNMSTKLRLSPKLVDQIFTSLRKENARRREFKNQFGNTDPKEWWKNNRDNYKNNE